MEKKKKAASVELKPDDLTNLSGGQDSEVKWAITAPTDEPNQTVPDGSTHWVMEGDPDNNNLLPDAEWEIVSPMD